jgi:hypothetical protein
LSTVTVVLAGPGELGQIRAFLAFPFGALEPIGGLVAHHLGDLAAEIKFSDAIWIMLRAGFVAW